MKNCKSCGTSIEDKVKFCINCGKEQISVEKLLSSENQQQTPPQINNQPQNFQQPVNNYVRPVSQHRQIHLSQTMPQMDNQKHKHSVLITSVLSACIIVITSVFLFLNNSDGGVFFTDSNNRTGANRRSAGEGRTTINAYSRARLNEATTTASVLNANRSDSLSQRSNCPREIFAIEDRIVNNYRVHAVNLCELDLEFARETERVIRFVHNEFPSAMGYLSHLTLGNLRGVPDGSLAVFTRNQFTSSTIDNHMGTRISIIFNAADFLDIPRLEAVMQRSVRQGHFPPNSNAAAIVAHEFGHYLSFIAAHRFHGITPEKFVTSAGLTQAETEFWNGDAPRRIIEEAYNNYRRRTGSNVSMSAWRRTISVYAVAKDENGKYIYDETIAEAFSDFYTNGRNAAPASLEIVAVLRRHLEM